MEERVSIKVFVADWIEKGKCSPKKARTDVASETHSGGQGNGGRGGSCLVVLPVLAGSECWGKRNFSTPTRTMEANHIGVPAGSLVPIRGR